MLCSVCDTENPEASTSCLSCGTSLASSVGRPLVERRLIHIVFCDLVDSTSLSEQLDPEDLRGVLEHFQNICVDVVTRFKGHVAQFLGDGALIYFGYPQAHEDDAVRAVRSGLQIVRALSDWEVRGHRVRLRVGIHSGLVVVGEIGVPGYRGQLAVGEAPSIAARVQAQAQPNTVLVTETTERLVQGFFTTTELGPRELRGRKHLVRLFQVLGETGARTKLEAAKGAGLTPFVARADEMAALHRAWEDALRGRGKVLCVCGEAGVGKSRLLDAFRATLGAEPFEEIRCSCLEHMRSTAFHPFAAALEDDMRRNQALGPDRRKDWLEFYAVRFGSQAPQAARVLSDLLSIALDHVVPDVGPATRRRQLTMEALSSWLLHVETEAPKLVIVEDLHWADASTLELIDALSERVDSRRALILLTFRAQLHLPSGLDHPSKTLALSPLTLSDASRIAQHVARGKHLPEGLTSRLYDWTRGVPLYVEECTKGVLESGMLTETADQFELVDGLPQSRIPESLAGPLTARIDGLSSAKPTAQLASVLGTQFRYEMLAAISQLSPEDLKREIDGLVASEIIVESATQPGQQYEFRHALLRDAAYQSLLLADRKAIHQRIVGALQGKLHEFAESRPEVVAYHAGLGGLFELAIQEWYRASEKALARAANWEALSHVDEGIQLLVHLADEKERYERQLSFEVRRGPALMAVKGYQASEVKETYRRALALCEKLGDPSRLFPVLWGLWANHFVAGELGPAKDFAEQVLAIARRSNEPALLVPALHALGYTLCYTADFPAALDLAQTGIALFDVETERRNVQIFQLSSTVALHHFAGVSLWMLGFPDRAAAEARKAIDLADALGHPPTRAYAQSAATWGVPFLTGNHEALNRAASKATELSKNESFSLWPPLVQVFQGWASSAKGGGEIALTTMRRGYDTFRAAGGGILRTTMRALIAQAWSHNGETGRALELVAKGLSDIASTNEHNYEPELHRIRGEIVATGPSPQEAEASFRTALSVARQQRARSLELRAAIALAAFLRERGRADEGRSLVREVYNSFVEGFETPDLCLARAAME
jgi:class 3 adenylate cyclase/predicted ATPase